jgi:thioredoxin 1
MSNAINLNKDSFEAEVIKSDIPVLVDFWAPWCMPCRMMAPILDELAGELANKLKIAKVNTEDGDNQELAINYQIQSIPNMKLFKQGKVIGEFIGMRSKEALKSEIENLI